MKIILSNIKTEGDKAACDFEIEYNFDSRKKQLLESFLSGFEGKPNTQATRDQISLGASEILSTEQ